MWLTKTVLQLLWQNLLFWMFENERNLRTNSPIQMRFSVHLLSQYSLDIIVTKAKLVCTDFSANAQIICRHLSTWTWYEKCVWFNLTAYQPIPFTKYLKSNFNLISTGLKCYESKPLMNLFSSNADEFSFNQMHQL